MNTGLLRPAVATAPTVYGIETVVWPVIVTSPPRGLQQHLPFTVLKHQIKKNQEKNRALQQHLPFTVLKRTESAFLQSVSVVATAPTVYGIETIFSWYS